MKRYEFVKQEGQMDCGVACLLMIIRNYKGGASREYLRRLANTTKEGTSAYDLLKAGEKFHFTTFGLKGKLEELSLDYLPVIAHVIKDNYYHFVVIYEIDFEKKTMLIADPAIGMKTISIEEFEKISTNYYLVFVQNGKILKIRPTRRIQKLVLNFMKKHSLFIEIILLLSFLYTFTSIISSFYFQVLLEMISNYFELPVFLMVAFVFLIVFVIRNFSKFLRMLFFSSILSKFDFYLFQNLYHHLFSLPFSYYQSRTVSDITSRITDLASVRLTAGNFFFSFLVDCLLLLFSFFVLFYLEPLLTLVVFFFVLLEFCLFFLFKRKLSRKIALIKEKYACAMSLVFDTLNNISSIRFIRREEYIKKKVVGEYQGFLESNLYYQKINQTSELATDGIHSFLEILIFFLGALFIQNGRITLSSFISYYFVLSFFFEPIHHFLSFLSDYMETKESLSRMEEVYEVEEEKVCANFPSSIENIKLQDIGFSYRMGNAILKSWSGEFQKGDRVLLYGESGCGKTTLSRILSGYENEYQGNILVNGTLILPMNVSSLRNHVSYIPQNAGLLNMSLRENILLGREVDTSKLKEVLKICHVTSITSKHILGMDMMIEEGGANLSGGERQRIILARSLLCDSDIYILDESLCNVDIQTEREILEGIFAYLKEKIVIVVSHRFYNEDLYNRKIKFVEGEVVCESYQ